jgi:hypothetical protein
VSAQQKGERQKRQNRNNQIKQARHMDQRTSTESAAQQAENGSGKPPSPAALTKTSDLNEIERAFETHGASAVVSQTAKEDLATVALALVSSKFERRAEWLAQMAKAGFRPDEAPRRPGMLTPLEAALDMKEWACAQALLPVSNPHAPKRGSAFATAIEVGGDSDPQTLSLILDREEAVKPKSSQRARGSSVLKALIRKMDMGDKAMLAVAERLAPWQNWFPVDEDSETPLRAAISTHGMSGSDMAKAKWVAAAMRRQDAEQAKTEIALEAQSELAWLTQTFANAHLGEGNLKSSNRAMLARGSMGLLDWLAGEGALSGAEESELLKIARACAVDLPVCSAKKERLAISAALSKSAQAQGGAAGAAESDARADKEPERAAAKRRL